MVVPWAYWWVSADQIMLSNWCCLGGGNQERREKASQRCPHTCQGPSGIWTRNSEGDRSTRTSLWEARAEGETKQRKVRSGPQGRLTTLWSLGKIKLWGTGRLQDTSLWRSDRDAEQQVEGGAHSQPLVPSLDGLLSRVLKSNLLLTEILSIRLSNYT